MKKTFEICVIGSGYVGLSMSVCLAELGHKVTCFDIDKAKIDKLTQGICPFHDPGLQKYLANSKNRNLHFTTDSRSALINSDVVFIAVGTPAKIDGSADLSQIYSAAETAVHNTQKLQVLVIKSTVPVGTCEALQQKYPRLKIVYNPEFLREGMALSDAQDPQRIILGSANESALSLIKSLYRPFEERNVPILTMDFASAEMTKYVANTMLAARVSLMNEVSRLCEKTGADIEQVRLGIGSDSRIGPDFLRAGLGFGGSCLPKDLSAIVHLGDQVQEDVILLKAIQAVNASQQDKFCEKILQKLNSTPAGKTVTIWGAAFKPGTDDIREAPSLYVIEWLQKQGCRIHVCDPLANEHVENHFKKSSSLSFFSDPLKAAAGADILCVLTEWEIFSSVDLTQLPQLMKKPVILDGRNVFNPTSLRALGVDYYSVGR